MVSLKAIAEKTHSSLATVSRALNDHPEVDPETRRRVLEVAQDLGYRRPADRRVDSSTIALAQTSRSGLYEYDTLLMRGLIDAAGQHDLDVLWVDLNRDKRNKETYTQFFRRKNVRGVVLRAFGDSRHVVETIAAEGIPAVSIGEKFEQDNISWIRINGFAESRRGVEHLISLGHWRIALVMHSRPTNDHRDREQGYRAAMAAAGLEVTPDLMLSIPVGPPSGAAAINQLLSLPLPPTAVYITDPETTVGALNRCHELGLKVPEDLSVVGFDDGIRRRSVYPRYSAVCQDTIQLGFEAGNWLARHLEGVAQAPLHEEMQTHFEVLQSTGVPPRTLTRVLPDGTRLRVESPARPEAGEQPRTS